MNKIQEFIEKCEAKASKMDDITNLDATMAELYNTKVTITMLGNTIELDFGAVIYNTIIEALTENINEL